MHQKFVIRLRWLNSMLKRLKKSVYAQHPHRQYLVVPGGGGSGPKTILIETRVVTDWLEKTELWDSYFVVFQSGK